MEKLFFDSWESILRIVIVGALAYIGLVVMLRFIGNRTLAQLNAFDFIITVALGSTLATVLLNQSIPLVNGLVGLALLIILQLGISALTVRSREIRWLVKTEPYLLFYKGKFMHEALRQHRVTEDEILQTVRSQGIGNLDDIEAVIIETNGKFSVISKLSESGRSTLSNVQGVTKESNDGLR